MKQIIEFLKQCQVYEETWNPADRAERSFRAAQHELRRAQEHGDKKLIRCARRRLSYTWRKVLEL